MNESENKIRSNVIHLLNQIGDESRCKKCNMTIYWVTHKNGKKTPYTSEGLNHFVDCPFAREFRTSPTQDRKSLAAGEEQGSIF